MDLDTIFLNELNTAERKYREYKFDLDLVKAEFALNLDWNKVNSNRESQGKPKITNEANRKHYFKLHFADEDEKLLELELKYKSILREFEVLVSE